MANYDSTLYTGQAAGKSRTQGHGLAATVKVAQATVAVDTSLAANDLLRFFYLPKGASVRAAILQSTDIDTNASPTVLIDVGDSGSATRIFSGSGVGKAGTSDTQIGVTTGVGYQYTDKTLVYGTVNTAGSTKASGTVSLTVFYTIDGLAD